VIATEERRILTSNEQGEPVNITDDRRILTSNERGAHVIVTEEYLQVMNDVNR